MRAAIWLAVLAAAACKSSPSPPPAPAADAPMSVAALLDELAAYPPGTKITVSGYPAFFFRDPTAGSPPETYTLGDFVKLGPHAYSWIEGSLASCEMSANQHDVAKASEPLVLTGTIVGVERVARTDTNLEVDLHDCTVTPDADGAVPVEQLYARMAGRIYTEVRVAGIAGTVSSDPVGVRLPLLAAPGANDRALTCVLAALPAPATRDAWARAPTTVTVRGTLRDDDGTPQLEPCALQ